MMFFIEDVSYSGWPWIVLPLRRLYNICSASLTVSRLQSHMSLFHCPHLIFTFFHSCLLLFQSFNASSSLTCITVFFPSLFTLCQCALCTFCTFFPLFMSFFFFLSVCFSHVLYPSPFLSPISTIFLWSHLFSPLKNTKSRGSKHKSRRKSKKQKRPSSVCNSLI